MLFLVLAIKATMLLAFAALCAGAARRNTAAIRHAIWLAGLAGVLVLPAGDVMLPRWEVLPVSASGAVPSAPAASGIILTVSGTAPRITWTKGFLVFWAAGTLLVLFRRLAGAWQAQQIVSRAKPAIWAEPCLNACLKELDYRDAVLLLQSGETSIPFNWGAGVVLPESLRSAPAGRLRAILLHEIAHIERADTLTQWIGHIATAVYWFHPLAWLALKRLRREREHACDDRVLELTALPSSYAAELMEAVRASQAGWKPAAALAIVEKSELEERVMCILDIRKKRGRLSRFGMGLIGAAALAVVLPLAATHSVGGGSTSLSGVVRDPSGAAVKGARVILTAPGAGGTATTVTDAAGHYRVSQLAAGSYEVEVLARGFRRLNRQVTLAGTDETKQDLTVDLGRVTEEMTVSAAPTPPHPPAVPAPPRAPREPGVAPPPAPPEPPAPVTPVKVVRQVRPVYPESAKAEKASGKVVLRGVISMDGSVIGLTTVSADRPDMEEAAKTAVQQWKFEPAKLNGLPVEVVTDVTIKLCGCSRIVRVWKVFHPPVSIREHPEIGVYS
jgi:TonB family protein